MVLRIRNHAEYSIYALIGEGRMKLLHTAHLIDIVRHPSVEKLISNIGISLRLMAITITLFILIGSVLQFSSNTIIFLFMILRYTVYLLLAIFLLQTYIIIIFPVKSSARAHGLHIKSIRASVARAIANIFIVITVIISSFFIEHLLTGEFFASPDS